MDWILDSGLYIDLIFAIGIGIVADMFIEEERSKNEEDKHNSSNK